MSNKPSRRIGDIVADFNNAIDCNNFDRLCDLERELDIVVRKRLKRLSYEGYPIKQMDALLSMLPQDYNTAQANRVMEILDDKTPMERLAEVG